MGDDILPELGDLIFSVLIGYAGALEFLYVVRHLYHWSCNHINATQNDADSLKRLQDRMRNELSEAEAKEHKNGMQTMKDGVLYKDGFRIDPEQVELERSKTEQNTPEAREKRKKEIEAELKRQHEIEVQTRQQLAEAEEKLEQQRKQAAAEEEEVARKLLEAERAREAEQKRLEEEKFVEEEREARKLLEREKQREEEELKRALAEEEMARAKREEEKRQQEEEERVKRVAEEEKKRRLFEEKALRAAEEQAAAEAQEQSLQLLEAERQHEQQQRIQEIEEETEAAENEWQLLESERLQEADQKTSEIREENERKQEESEEKQLQHVNVNEAHANYNQKEASETETLNNIMHMLDVESERKTNENNYDKIKSQKRAERQKLIEENARKFLEADQEMEELLETVQAQRHFTGTDSAPQSPIYEEPCIRRTISPLTDKFNNNNTGLTSTVKTQFGQKSNDLYSLTTKPLLFKSISDDTPSFEPQSSFSPQPSEDYAGGGVDGGDEFSQLERQEPDGEDQDNVNASAKYTEDYLRSLDGIKQRPLVREDGTGRRRAFKKRRSSGSSNSSFDSRASRDEELKMFTSLEEEELQPKKQGENDDYTPIKYTNEPLLKVKMPRRRHKRSPAKDAKPGDRNMRGSLEMLDEEANTNPWGEVTPEHYKDMPFWKREKSMSIDEEALEIELPAAKKEEEIKDIDSRIEPKALAFEEATHKQNEQAITALQKQLTKEEEAGKNQQEPVPNESQSDIQRNLQTELSHRKSASPRLRRSPRIDDETDQYEDLWNKTNEHESVTLTTAQTPAINIELSPDVAPWRDQYGLLMEGISDFYDFTASTNPSRSRSTSRQVSPARTQPNTTQPKKVEFVPLQDSGKGIIDVYDDIGNVLEAEITKENVINFLEELHEDCGKFSLTITDQLQNVADSPEVSVDAVEGATSHVAMNLLVQTLPIERQSRSRSRSPLPTGDQLTHSVQTRRNRLIEKNDKLFKTLNQQLSEIELAIESPKIVIESPTVATYAEDSSDKVRLLVEEEHRARSRSPLPTFDNLERSLETRRSKRIKKNYELCEKLGLDISASRTPSPTELHSETSQESSDNAEEVCTRENMHTLVESLRVERLRSHSHSRSRSPLPTAENLKTGLELRRKKKIQQNDEIFQKLHIDIHATTTIKAATTIMDGRPQTAPLISIQCWDEEEGASALATNESPREGSENTIESMTSLVESLRLQRSRSKSPMRRLERERTPEPTNLRVGLIAPDQLSEGEDEHERRSRTPSRSMSLSPTRTRGHTISAPQTDIERDFHQLLNLEASQQRTLSKCSEELESILAEKQREVDSDALRKLSNASEEIELHTVTSIKTYEHEDKNKLEIMSNEERLHQLRCSPTTPYYDRTVSQEWNDVQRIKDEMLTSGFKRSTYVGESEDLGSEFAPLREQTARFRRSRSPSPSLVSTESRQRAYERRELQDNILAELVSASAKVASDAERLGAKPKEVRSMSKDIQSVQYEELRRLNAEFSRSRSQSRSPLGEVEAEEVAKIAEVAAKRELEDSLKPNISFQEFSRYLNAGFLDNERRASDSALIQKPEVYVQLQELEEEVDVEPENYHHFRRFSLNQEQSIEEYPHDDDYVLVSQIEVQTANGTRTWIREDFYPEDFDQLDLLKTEAGESVELTIEAVNEAAESHFFVAEDDDATDGSEDERQTVVEVEDEIDEDICDFNERGPADESHHEQSECEEAEREMDRYADREANDWQQIESIDQFLLGDDELLLASEEGAVGGDASNLMEYDSDSAVIDEIYDEAIRNRKPSGILRDYDIILKEMQTNYMSNNMSVTTDGSEADMSGASDSDRQNNKKKQDKGEMISHALKLIKNEHAREKELRYLADASMSATRATRLRTRYGYAPQLHAKGIDKEDIDLEVDLNYKPKREYNWRKNFKVDDDEVTIKMNGEQNKNNETEMTSGASENRFLDLRKYSLGGESITLFSQGAEGVCYVADENQLNAGSIKEEDNEGNNEIVCECEVAALEQNEEQEEKPKKKKNKKKLRKETRNCSIEQYNKDEDDSETQLYSRRSSSIQLESDSPNRSTTKSRSRRNSRNSLTNDERNAATFSPRRSAGVMESSTAVYQANDSPPISTKKKLKKRKKIKEEDIKEEPTSFNDLTINVPTASAAVSPSISSNCNPLASLSPQNSICTPLSSLDSEVPDSRELISAPSSAEGSPAQEVKGESAYVEVDVSSLTLTHGLVTSLAEAAVQKTTTTTCVASSTTEAPAAASTSPASITSTKGTLDTFDILKDANFYPLF